MKKWIMLIAVGFMVVNAEAAISETETNTKTVVASDLIPDDIAIQHAMTEFKSLTRVERKAKIAEVKKLVSTY
ncbi:hypothetical protein ACUOH1_25450, partial [Escherichia coli]